MFSRIFGKSSSRRDEDREPPTIRRLLERAADPRDTGVPAIGMSHAEFKAMSSSQDTPSRLYRSHVAAPDVIETFGALRTSDSRGSDYYCDIIKHTARTSGSGGAVLSLATESATARRFGSPDTSFVTIRTDQEPHNYQTIAKILNDHADPLMRDGKIRQATVVNALTNIQRYQEKEYFYVGGSGNIPPHHIEEVTRSRTGGLFDMENGGLFHDVHINRR
jgi:hypothetical protein